MKQKKVRMKNKREGKKKATIENLFLWNDEK